MKQLKLIVIMAVLGTAVADDTEDKARTFIDQVYNQSNILATELGYKEWAYQTEGGQAATSDYEAAQTKNDNYQKSVYKQVMSFPWKTFTDPELKRKFFIWSFLGETALSDTDSKQYSAIKDNITNTINGLKAREYNSADNTPKLNSSEVTDRVTKDNMNVDELTFYWTEWHNQGGPPIKNLFTQLIAMQNKAANLCGFPDAGSMRQAHLEIDDFENTMLKLYNQILPLYKELHGYIRHKLWLAYGNNDSIVNPNGAIPFSLLPFMGNSGSLTNMLMPYSANKTVQVNEGLKSYTNLKMAQTANSYFKSLGFDDLPNIFWEKSILPTTPDEKCNAKIFNFYNGYDYRMSFCVAPTKYIFAVMHDYVGLTEYAIEYAKQPYFFRQAPSIAFQNGLETLIVELAGSPYYLRSLGLLGADVQPEDEELKINTLFVAAMTDVYLMPYRLALDQWRWQVYQGKTTPETYNCDYWKTLTKLHGTEPPVDRTNQDFDVVLNSAFLTGGQLITYYIGAVLKYEMMQGLCETAGYYAPGNANKPLLFCDIHNNKGVGAKLKEMMKLGDSRPWYEALQTLIGKNTLDAAGMLEYFKPLYFWLQTYNRNNNVTVGWPEDQTRCH